MERGREAGDGMKIAIIGYGNMGKEVERQAKANGIEVAAIIDPEDSAAQYKSVGESSLRQADVAIDFSSQKTELSNIEMVAGAGKDMVVGTTGWYNGLEEAGKIVRRCNTGLVYSPNFSIGASLFMKIVEYASRLMDKAPEYDPYIYEAHHSGKADSPSGTGRALADAVIRNVKRKKSAVFDRLDRRIKPDELHVASLRAGSIPGIHTVGFDSASDTIELTHTARSRAGFASGAIYAAKWIAGKKGIFSMEDMVRDMMQGGEGK